MAAITSQRTTGNVASTQRVVEMHKPILLLEPESAPLTVILNNIYEGGRRRAAKDPLFKWHNDELESRFDAIDNAAGYAAGATSLNVDTGALFAAEDLVKVPRTGELISITSVSANTLTVVRGFGGTTAAALVDNDPLYVVGTAAEEGDTSQAPRSDNPAAVTNYTQIFKHTIASTGTWLSASNESDPHDWSHQAKKQAIEHNKDKELAFLLGGPGTTTGADGGPRRTTGGVLHFATQNNQDAGGTLTEAEFETFMRAGFRYGSKRKVLFASRLLVSVLNAFASGKLQTVTGAKTYGVQVMEYLSAHGSLKLISHPLLDGVIYGGYGIIIDFNDDDVAYRYLDGSGPAGSRDTKMYANRQENDRDGRRDEWISECGLQFGSPKKHAVLTNVTG